MATKNETEAAGAPAPPEGTDPPKYVTADDLNTALSARLKPFEQKLEKWLETSVGQTFAKLRDELLPKAAPTPPAPPEPKGEKRKEETQELRALHDQVAQLTRQAEEARAERDAERAKARDTTMRQRVADVLAAGGVEGVRMRHAVGFLVDAEKRVRWNDDHTALSFRDEAGGDVELEAGVRGWLKSEDGKYYLPARAAAGSGDRPGASPPPRAPGAPIDRSTVAEGLRRALTGQLG